jgi:hypothetical protein
MRSVTIMLASVLLAGTAFPAFAAWDRIGSVDFTRRDTRDVHYGNFGGPVEALGLRARGADIFCEKVTATFMNGSSKDVFRGELPQGREITLDLPTTGDRRVQRLDFDCEPTNRRDGSVAISADVVADVGQYQDDWRKSPDWDSTWSRIFDWANPNRR